MRTRWIPLLAAACLTLSAAEAGPLRAVEGGGLSHQHSGWVFAPVIAGLELEERPQDLAGPRDASTVYHGGDIEARVDLIAKDSPEKPATIADTRALFAADQDPKQWTFSETTLTAGKGGAITLTRLMNIGVTEKRGAAIYLAQVGAWRVRITMFSDHYDNKVLERFDAFARGQRWESLAGG